jgi:hypothetical protein
MNSSTRRLLVTLSLGLGLALALVWVLGGGMFDVAQAQSGTGIIRVTTNGKDAPGCGSVLTPCLTVQYAVDTAFNGEEIHVATGVYTGVQGRPVPVLPSPYSYPGPSIITQVVYISKTVTVRGGL